MIRVCAWCGKALSKSDGEASSVTHGICRECAEAVVSRMGQGLRKFLETLDAPVVTTDASGVIGFANQKAAKLLGRTLPSIEGQMVGTVTDCAYSRLPGGCRRTEHCTACTLREVIDTTVATGRTLSDITVVQNVLTGDGLKAVTYKISSENVDGLVFLKIRELADH